MCIKVYVVFELLKQRVIGAFRGGWEWCLLPANAQESLYLFDWDNLIIYQFKAFSGFLQSMLGQRP